MAKDSNPNGSGATFTMTGGIISGNSASNYGGGVYIEVGTFTKTGGTIYGYSVSDTVNSNTVKDNNSGAVRNYQGHAVYAGSSNAFKIRESTAGPGVNMDSRVSGSAGVGELAKEEREKRKVSGEQGARSSEQREKRKEERKKVVVR